MCPLPNIESTKFLDKQLEQVRPNEGHELLDSDIAVQIKADSARARWALTGW